MDDTDVFDPPADSSQFPFRPARPPPLLDAPPFSWSSAPRPAVESFGGRGVFCSSVLVVQSVCGQGTWASLVLHLLRGTALLEGVLGESPAWSSRIGDIDACGCHFLLGGVALCILSPSGENPVQFWVASVAASVVVHLLGGLALKALLFSRSLLWV
uniref:Uncharacterized protein n=1 Tax=Oryza meridionalis TaxID=40149 RepID=A0A0E0CMF8_9ORYZ